MNAPIVRSIRITALAFAITAAIGAAQAAEMTLFKQPQFSGDKLTLRGDTTNLSGAGFQDQVSSVVVHSGRWQVCTQPEFGGDCTVLERGEYPQLAQNLNHRIESAREVGRSAQNDRYRGERFANYDHGRSGVVELFPAPDFRGRPMRIDGDMDALNDRMYERGVSSFVIHDGRWQVCTRPGFEGVCRVYEPGEYADLGRLDNRVGSLRRIG